MAVHNTPIIPAADRVDANEHWNVSAGWNNAFVSGLVPANGPADAEPTHYWASAQFEKFYGPQYAQFQENFPQGVYLRFDGSASGNVTYTNQQLASLNLQRYNPFA